MNVRKKQVLGLLADFGMWRASDVAVELGIKVSHASQLLRRYHMNGLVGRERLRGPRAPPRGYFYFLAERGYERLQWLIERTEWRYVEYG